MGPHNQWLFNKTKRPSRRIRDRTHKAAKARLAALSRKRDEEASRREVSADEQIPEGMKYLTWWLYYYLCFNYITEHEMHDLGVSVDNEVGTQEYNYDGEALELLDLSLEDPVQPEAERLYPGSNLSAVESSTLVQAFALKNSLTRSGTKDLLNILQLLLPEKAKVPTSQYLLQKSVNLDMSSVKKCFYCNSCQNSVVTTGNACEHCGARINERELIKDGKYFLMFFWRIYLLRNHADITQRNGFR